MTYLHDLYQIPRCTRYTGDRITSCTCLQLILIENNTILGSAQFMFDFQGMHFNAKKYLYINFQKHASTFHKAMLSTLNGVWHVQSYVLPKIVCVTTNNDFPIEYICSGIICQHDLTNIINIYQGFIKLLHQPTKPHILVGQFPNKLKENK